jgi:diguanylate cyclase (GGDEF)-like protein
MEISDKSAIRWWNIRNRILLFTILVTAIPAIGLGSLYYIQSRSTLLASAEQEMLATTNQAARELELWFQERYYELRVLATSYLVTENLSLAADDQDDPKSSQARQDITAYLSLVISRFAHFDSLLVYDNSGKLVSADRQRDGLPELPGDWQQQAQSSNVVIGNRLVADQQGPASIFIAIPILANDASVTGLLGATLPVDILAQKLHKLAGGKSLDSEFLLLDKNALVIASSIETARAGESRQQAARLFTGPAKPSDYINDAGQRVIGMLAPVKNFNCALVLERSHAAMFAGLVELRNLSLVVVTLLLLVMGLFAWVVAHGILRPLESLRQSAEAVADGDMDIQMPVTSQDELGIATMAFNQMVEQLRQQREALEQLTITDKLTGLMNRSKILTELEEHVDRYRRFGLVFSLLMIDVDYFKQINDQHGHLAGDAVLARLGKLFSELTRSIDTTARYGGEEFVILLEGTEMQQAIDTAERIRSVIENTEIAYEDQTIRFTISIGVSQINSDDQDVDDLLRQADEALYKAKSAGRNQTVSAGKVTPRVVRYPEKHDDK